MSPDASSLAESVARLPATTLDRPLPGARGKKAPGSNTCPHCGGEIVFRSEQFFICADCDETEEPEPEPPDDKPPGLKRGFST